MTHDEISNLKNHEIDALIANIMEPKPPVVTVGELRKAEKDWRYSYFGKSSPRGWWHAFIGTDAGADDNLALWEPYWKVSEEIDAAWGVVEHFISRRKRPSIIRVSDGEWKVQLDDFDPGAVAYAETAPLAICRAALLAVMGGV